MQQIFLEIHQQAKIDAIAMHQHCTEYCKHQSFLGSNTLHHFITKIISNYLPNKSIMCVCVSERERERIVDFFQTLKGSKGVF
jgi:hypothetical protein